VTLEFILTDPWGDMKTSSDLQEIDELVRRLDMADLEHPEVAVSQPEGWTLSAYANGTLVFENVEARPSSPRHMRTSRAEATRLMKLLATGDTGTLEAEPWLAGYPLAAK
jgi:hypothetical protein